MKDFSPAYPGFNVLLMGPSGTGKTYSIKSLVDTGLDVFALFLEPGLETLIGAYADAGEPIPPNLHYFYLAGTSQGFDALKSMADNIGKFDLAGLAKMKDIKRSQANLMLDLYTQLNNFTDQKDGKTYGSVDSWENTSVLVIDSLSALNRIAMDTVVGNKPVKDMAGWGSAQNLVMNTLHKLTSGCLCHFVLIAHVELNWPSLASSIFPKELTTAFGSRSILPLTMRAICEAGNCMVLSFELQVMSCAGMGCFQAISCSSVPTAISCNKCNIF